MRSLESTRPKVDRAAQSETVGYPTKSPLWARKAAVS